MRSIWLGLVVSVLAVIAFTGFDHSGAQPPKTETPKGGPAKARIVPVVMLKPGETKELLLSTWCTVGITRSEGLLVRETTDKATGGKVWKRDGVTVEVPGFEEATKAAAPVYSALKKQGLDAFIVKVTAAKDAKPGLYDLHVADFTCSGACDTDFRVLVIAP
jgi:hypothetical protein